MLEINGQFKQWIDDASYEDLLRRWRFSEAGDPIFVGELGEYYKKIMFEKRDKTNHVAASKKIGWEDSGASDWKDNE